MKSLRKKYMTLIIFTNNLSKKNQNNQRQNQQNQMKNQNKMNNQNKNQMKQLIMLLLQRYSRIFQKQKQIRKIQPKHIFELYKYFKSNDMIDLLSEEKEIIYYLEQQYKLTSTLKNKLCGIYKCYSLLNIESKF